MNITECVPLAGRGLIARRGHLVALTGGTDAGPDPLLTALTAVAYASGDGAALVLAGTRAAAEHEGRPAWACAGVTSGEEVAILVHGEAVALVSVDGSPEAQVTASGSMIPVVGAFTGAVVTVRLVIGPPAPPDPRLWLEAGTVFGGGIVLTIKQDKPGNLIPNDPYASVAATMRPAMEQAVGNMVLHPPGAGPAGRVPAPPGVAPGEVYPEDVLRLRRGARCRFRAHVGCVAWAGHATQIIPFCARGVGLPPGTSSWTASSVASAQERCVAGVPGFRWRIPRCVILSTPSDREHGGKGTSDGTNSRCGSKRSGLGHGG